MTAEEEEIVAAPHRLQELGRQLRDAPEVTLHLSAYEAFVVVAQMQLALRHPQNRHGVAAVLARQIARNISALVESRVPAAASILRDGWDPSRDVPADDCLGGQK